MVPGSRVTVKKIKKSFADAGFRLDKNDVKAAHMGMCCYRCAKFGYGSTTEGSYRAAIERCYCFNIRK